MRTYLIIVLSLLTIPAVYLFAKGNSPFTNLEIRVFLILGYGIALGGFVSLILVRNGIVANTKHLIFFHKEMGVLRRKLDQYVKSLDQLTRKVSARTDANKKAYDGFINALKNSTKK